MQHAYLTQRTSIFMTGIESLPPMVIIQTCWSQYLAATDVGPSKQGLGAQQHYCMLQAMDNSVGNMGKQLGSLIQNKGQQSANLQQTPAVDAANTFQQV